MVFSPVFIHFKVKNYQNQVIFKYIYLILKLKNILKDVILYAVFFYVRYGVSYRDLEEIMEERGVNVDHATLNRWVIRYAPAIAAKAHSQKRNTNRSWRMDETYIKVKGEWVYLYRAVDSHGDTLDFMLSERRDEDCQRIFHAHAVIFKRSHIFRFFMGDFNVLFGVLIELFSDFIDTFFECFLIAHDLFPL
jgi:hypothetical protein